MLALAELLASADGPEELWSALVTGVGAMFTNHFIVATFHFRDDWPAAVWRSAPARERPAEWWARNWTLHPGLPWLMANPGIAIGTVSDVLTEAELSAHLYYREFMEPEGWRYGLAFFFWTKTGIGGFVGVNRRQDQGDFSQAERETARAVHGVIAGAYRRIAHRVRADDSRRAFEALLAKLPVAVLLYAVREDRVVFANSACREALAHWRGEAALKRRAISAALLPAEIVLACARASFQRVEVRHPGNEELRAIVHCVSNPAALIAERVVQVIIERRDRQRASAAWLSCTRVLSVREREVAELAACGLSNVQISLRLKKSPHTIKKQLEITYDKLGMGGRGQLSALYAGVPPLHSVREAGADQARPRRVMGG